MKERRGKETEGWNIYHEERRNTEEEKEEKRPYVSELRRRTEKDEISEWMSETVHGKGRQDT
ncbi:hypothetical protein PRIPAC_77792 [Pristionchus pacificus]|uniref:Uncharacterized protein n=1 Tax=Pristionchus pacificus TaxID=54126 RepID=A0A2A6C4N5_PRIPA|nr:hypothetical protein PRIPAC_77792 [Pristionchus pacificus]|eukprot:PDM73013.1 hypothetical protein PRIPAC_39447 [Pristionchus pacificus]